MTLAVIHKSSPIGWDPTFKDVQHLQKPCISTSISCYMVRPGLPCFGVFSTMPWGLKTGPPRKSTEMRLSLDSSLTRFRQCVHTDLSLRASMMATNYEVNLHHQCHCSKSHLPIVVPAFGMGTLAMGSGTAPVKHVDFFNCSRQPRIAWNRPVGEVWLAGAFVFSKKSVSTQGIWEKTQAISMISLWCPNSMRNVEIPEICQWLDRDNSKHHQANMLDTFLKLQ